MKILVRAIVPCLFGSACVIASAQGMGGANREDMSLIHQLLGHHTKIHRSFRKLKNGVETVTESMDPKVATTIHVHALAMQKRMKEGRPIRNWDPLFAELFRNHAKITMTVAKTKNGVKVTETSNDPYAITLIQWHAEAVSGFVKEGMAGMHKEHPAPPRPGQAKSAFVGTGDGITTCPVTGEPVRKEVSAVIQGRTVSFCCAGCIDRVKKEPKRYLKWTK